MSAQLLIPAAGLGRRLGLPTPKALVELCGVPLIAHTIARLLPVSFTEPVIVVTPPGWEESFREALRHIGVGVCFVAGGLERRDSVRRGLELLNPATEIVAIHDAARPFVPLAAVRRVIEAAHETGAATVATPVADTILQADAGGFLADTPDRSALWACQTPQAFQVQVIRRAHDAPQNKDALCTDDATMAHRCGVRVRLVDGGAGNFKVTTPHDLAFAAYLLEHGES